MVTSRAAMRAQHQAVEIVVFDLAGPDLRERFFEQSLHALDVELGVVREFEAEVVDPRGRARRRGSMR